MKQYKKIYRTELAVQENGYLLMEQGDSQILLTPHQCDYLIKYLEANLALIKKLYHTNEESWMV